MRLVRIALVALLALIQWPLWFGDGGWLRAWERERQLAAAKQSVDQLKQRNAALEAEVHDLRDGTAAVEERARAELGMIRSDEVFVQVLPSGESASPTTGGATAPPPSPSAAPTAPHAAAGPAAAPSGASAAPVSHGP